MKKKALIAIAIIIILGAIVAIIFAGIKMHQNQVNQDKHLIKLSFDDLNDKINNKDTFILVITQTKCSHCKEYKPNLKKVLADYDIYAYEIEQDTLTSEERKKLDNIIEISGTPTTVFIIDGVEQTSTNRLIGPADETKLINRFKAMGYIE